MHACDKHDHTLTTYFIHLTSYVLIFGRRWISENKWEKEEGMDQKR
jgi:hypothetical protein